MGDGLEGGSQQIKKGPGGFTWPESMEAVKAERPGKPKEAGKRADVNQGLASDTKSRLGIGGLSG